MGYLLLEKRVCVVLNETVISIYLKLQNMKVADGKFDEGYFLQVVGLLKGIDSLGKGKDLKRSVQGSDAQ